MKEILIDCLAFVLLLCLYIIKTFVIAYIVAFLLKFIHIYKIIGYDTKYFLFFVFLIINIIKGIISTINNLSKKLKDDL